MWPGSSPALRGTTIPVKARLLRHRLSLACRYEPRCRPPTAALIAWPIAESDTSSSQKFDQPSGCRSMMAQVEAPFGWAGPSPGNLTVDSQLLDNG